MRLRLEGINGTIEVDGSADASRFVVVGEVVNGTITVSTYP